MRKTIEQPNRDGVMKKTVAVIKCIGDACVNITVNGGLNDVPRTLTLDNHCAQELAAALVAVSGGTTACPGCPVKFGRPLWTALPPMPAPPPVPAPLPVPAPKRRPHGAQEYKGNGKHKWEEVTVDAKGAGHTYRLRVPGGYLYRTVTNYQDAGDPMDGQPLASSTVFVPMPDVVGYAV